MPSNAYKEFINNIKDTDALIVAHQTLKSGSRGKQGLGHITRSGILMLCASFELYIETLVKECVTFLIANKVSPMDLPKEVKKNLATQVKEEKNELLVLHLSGDGWKLLYENYAKKATDGLNTPKFENIDKLFLKFVGFSNFSQHWQTVTPTDIDDFVSKRGEIAHTGRQAKYIKINELIKDTDIIKKFVRELDELILNYLTNNNPHHLQPWRRTY